MPGSFIDTNIILYLTSSDEKKAARSEQVIREGGTISVQVLNELTNVARRKMQMPWPEARALLSIVRSLLAVQPLTLETHEVGLRLAERYALTVYDAMIAASALEADCETLWSEDMQSGMLLEERLRILNPFLASGEEQAPG
jgi:predicted nucleic acid-binding protein